MTNFMDYFGDFAGIIKALIILLAGLIAAKLILFFVKKGLEKSKLDEALYKFVTHAVRIMIWIIIVVAMLSAMGVNTTVFISILSAAGAAIAIALRDSLANIAGGLIIIFTKPFARGDYVSVDSNEGSIQDIDLMTTSMLTVDNKTVIIPNGIITTSAVVNYSREGIRHVSYEYMVAYDTDMDRARDILENVARSNPYMLLDREVTSGVTAHSERGIIIVIRLWIDSENYYESEYFMNQTVKTAFDEAGIEIPFSRIDIKVKK